MTSGKLKQLLMVVAGASALIPSPMVVHGFGVTTIHSRVSVSHARTRSPRSPSGPLLALITDYDIDARRSTSTTNDSSINNRHSASDWLYNVMSLPKSSVLRDIRNPVLTIAVWSTLVSLVQRFLATRSSRMLQTMAANMCVGPTPHNFLVSSLGLLLVFRTNSAYQRFYVSGMV
jgi:Bestrophin, RFP-TM, chloride channel